MERNNLWLILGIAVLLFLIGIFSNAFGNVENPLVFTIWTLIFGVSFFLILRKR